ncbi:autophagy-related protein 11-domain-containing protein [Dichotomocladium elegans]|nr:autophagy-related protein 11-domain-containing protein [Dichotomocladium elegans]
MLHAMSQQLDGLRDDFFKALESTFFPNALMQLNVAEAELQQKTKTLTRAEAQIKSYEIRIASLEKALQKSYQAETALQLPRMAPKGEPNATVTNPATSPAESTASSGYSVQQQSIVDDVRRQHSADQEMWENERDDMRLQIQELEQLLEDERQTYEYNRRSLLKEAQMKDDLADMRIASLEDDWCAKSTLDAERQQHEAEQKALQRANEEKLREKDQEIQRIVDINVTYVKELTESKADLEKLRIEYAEYRTASEESLRRLNDSEQARDNIKQQLAKTRDMVARAENDWMSKQESLEKALHEQEKIQASLTDILATHGRMPEEIDTWTLINTIKECLESMTVRAKTVEKRNSDIEQEREQLVGKLNRLEEEYNEVKRVASNMADKLEEFRKDIFYGMTHQLQLPIDEEEVKALTKKIAISKHDDDAAIWSQVIQVANGLNANKFVDRVREKIRDAHDLGRRWKREYKDLREKYHKIATSSHDKIAFRNFQIGDVALFLPTRNSTGKPWAAFNINAPHYFLKPSESIEQQIHQREWLVARITSLTEYTVTSDPLSNPYGLAEGIIYYHLEVENWKSSHHRRSHRSQSSRKPGSTKVKGKEPETGTSVQQPFPMIPKPSPVQDTGLASISTQGRITGGAESSASAYASGSAMQAKSSYPMSFSTSSVVHSYVPTSTPSTSGHERRHSYFGQESRLPREPAGESVDPALAWVQPQE